MTTSIALPPGFTAATLAVNSTHLHYVRGGTGEPLVLLHGWPQTWRCWQGLLPQLAAHYDVLAVDLRGAGGSGRPAAGYEARTMADDLYHLTQDLGLGPLRLVGHDIGLMVAYAYATAYPAATHKLVLLDALIPGVEPLWSQFLADPRAWIFHFHQTPHLPAALTAGKERTYLTFAYEGFAHWKGAIPPASVDEYVQAYAGPGGMQAGFNWYRAFAANAAYNQQPPPLTLPVLARGGEYGMGPFMLAMVRQVAPDVRGGSIPACGHWLAKEAPDYLLAQLLSFLPG